MGYGGILKKVVRIAIPVAVSIATGGNPWATALASSATTAATGGSFKESLMAGATSYIGSSITQSFNQAANAGLGEQIASGNAAYTSAATSSTGEAIVTNSAGEVLASGAAADAAMSAAQSAAASGTSGGLLDQIASGANQAVGGNTVFNAANASTGFGGFIEGGKEFFSTPFEWLQAGGDELLGSNMLNVSSAIAGSAPQTLAGALIGGATTMTLNEALSTGNIEALEQAGYTPYQISLLQNEARNALSQGRYDEFLANTPNPGLSDEEFGKVIASGIERRNVELGSDITEDQFNAGFQNLTGQGILNQETGIRKQSFNNTLDQTFTGDAFGSIDDDIINSIVESRSGDARQQVSNFAARGNLNPIGGQQANDFLNEQFEGAGDRVRDIGAGVLGQRQGEVDSIKSTAQNQISGYSLGDDLFDVTPFATQRENLVNERQGTLGSDIETAVGQEPLFNVSGALQAGGRAQGVTSGPDKSFLDAIAAREQAANTQRRGLGTRRSGAF